MAQRTAGTSATWQALARSVFSGGLAGIVSGVVFVGVGSRLTVRFRKIAGDVVAPLFAPAP